MGLYLIDNGYNFDGSLLGDNKIAKALAAQTDWNKSTIMGSIGDDIKKNNRTGFSGYPSGWRNYDGTFSLGSGNITAWWHAPEAGFSFGQNRSLCNVNVYLGLNDDEKAKGVSVRLVKD